MELTPETVLEARRELCKRSLAAFVKMAWHVIEPATPYVHGRHIDVMCAKLEAAARGEIRRLIINVPPGTAKSSIVGVFFPMWLWGPCGRAGERFVGVAHEQSLGIRDNLKCRRLATSPWFQRLWPIKIAGDQNEKLNFENSATGFRAVATPSNVTGRRGTFVLVDDPISAENANSEAERSKVNTWFQESLPTRMNDPEKSVIILVMQRLHEMDPTGLILSKKWGWEHLNLPMRFEPDRASPDDWRTDEGELLFPERFPEHVVAELEATLGAYATAGQLQQRPAPREGGLFKRSWFKTVGAAPVGERRYVRAWDLAATKKVTSNNPDWTAGVLMSRGADGMFLIEGCERLRGSPMEVMATVRGRAGTDPKGTIIRIPKDPGQAGVAQAETFVKDLAGFSVKVVAPSGDKATRAMPAASQAEVGNVAILVTGDADRDAWIEPFLAEVAMFPGAAHDDQVDAFADALNELALGGSTYSPYW